MFPYSATAHFLASKRSGKAYLDVRFFAPGFVLFLCSASMPELMIVAH